MFDPAKKYYKATVAHEYTELAKTSLGNTELYHIYGIVVDATTPHIKVGEKNPALMFKTHLKIIDPTVYPKGPGHAKDDMTNCTI